nr:Chain C, PH STOMATIN PH1511 [Pyrococcus horikoshii OT3]3WG5_C Chain C, PH1511 stomatin [Pyrococcus horikoshii OT3]
NVIVLMLPME